VDHEFHKRYHLNGIESKANNILQHLQYLLPNLSIKKQVLGEEEESRLRSNVFKCIRRAFACEMVTCVRDPVGSEGPVDRQNHQILEYTQKMDQQPTKIRIHD